MNWKKIIGIIVGLALVAAFVLKLKTNKEIASERVYQYDKAEAIPVKTQVLQFQNLESEQPFSGTFEPTKESKLSAETQGKVNRVTVEVGDYVRKGQTLIELDKALLDQQFNSTNVQLENAKTNYTLKLNTLDIQIKALQKDIDRYGILTEVDAIKGIQLEKLEQQMETAIVQKTALLQKAAIKLAEANKNSIQEQIKKTSIKAPFNGIITAKLTEIGSFAAPGMPLLQLTNIDQLKFTINVSENDLGQFKQGATHTILTDVFSDVTLKGKTTMIGSKANMGGSYPIQFTVNNTTGNRIKSGMFGRVVLNSSNISKGILIPSSAIIGGSTQPQVYIVKQGKAALQNVTVSQIIDDKSVISEGVQEADTIVVSGFINLFNGANVSFN